MSVTCKFDYYNLKHLLNKYNTALFAQGVQGRKRQRQPAERCRRDDDDL